MQGPGEGILRHTAALAGATLLSRLTGFARDAAILAVFGAAGSAPWLLAWRLPNVMRRLVAEGALTVAFVPLLADRLGREGRPSARRFLDQTATLVFLSMSTFVLGAIAAMPWIVGLLAPEWRADPAAFAEVVRLARWAFPFLLTVTLVAVAMGVLNVLRRFFVPAASSVLVNLSVLFGALVLSRWVDPPLLALPYALLVGGVLQLAANGAALVHAGFTPRPSLELRDPSLRRLLLLMAPATFGASIHQVNILLSTAFATTLGQAPLSWLYAADRLVELPLGVLAVSVATASLPALSEHAALGRLQEWRETFASALRQVLWLTLPAAAGLAVLALPVVAVVFQRGRLSFEDSIQTASALAAYAAGLPAIGAARVVVQGFYSWQDTRTPVIVGVISVAAFAALALLLMPAHGHLGIAAAVSGAGWINLLAALALLRRRAGPLGLRRIAGTLWRSGLGLLALAAAAFATARLGDWASGAGGLNLATLRNVSVLGAAVLAGAGAYLATTLLARSEEARGVVALLARRLGRRAR